MESESQDWNYDSRLPSEPDVCANVTELLLEQLEEFGWTGKDTFGIHMAFEEAMMNAIRHGNECDEDKEVHVVISITDTNFYAKITDQGCGFDPDSIPDPTDDDNVDKSCGRGVMLMKNFIDEVIFNSKGNSVELKKAKSN